MTAQTVKGRKAKGRNLQNLVAEKVRALLGCHEEDVRPAIMGERGQDIKISPGLREKFPYAIECKAVEALNIWDALRQAEFNANIAGLKPLLVFKRNRTKVYATLPLDDLLALMEVKK
jgi:hypothetical protein